MVTTVGLGDIKACTPAEEVLASFQMLLGVFLFGLIVSTSQYVLLILLHLLFSIIVRLSFFLIAVVVSASQCVLLPYVLMPCLVHHFRLFSSAQLHNTVEIICHIRFASPHVFLPLFCFHSIGTVCQVKCMALGAAVAWLVPEVAVVKIDVIESSTWSVQYHATLCPSCLVSNQAYPLGHSTGNPKERIQTLAVGHIAMVPLVSMAFNALRV